MLLKNVKRISLLVAISTVLTGFSVNAASLEETTVPPSEFTEAASYKAINNDGSENMKYHEHPIEYTDENGNYILEYNQFKVIKKPGGKYSSVNFNEGLTSLSSVIDKDIDIAFFDVVGDIIVPDTVTTISSESLGGVGVHALDNKEIEKYPCTLKLSNLLEEIPDDMCYESSFIGTLRIPNSVKKIGSLPFSSCNFETIVVPKTVDFIESNG